MYAWARPDTLWGHIHNLSGLGLLLPIDWRWTLHDGWWNLRKAWVLLRVRLPIRPAMQEKDEEKEAPKTKGKPRTRNWWWRPKQICLTSLWKRDKDNSWRERAVAKNQACSRGVDGTSKIELRCWVDVPTRRREHQIESNKSNSETWTG